jgi:hypothetical protein
LCRRISFKNRDAVAVATKHGRRAQSDCASTAERDFAHLYPQVHLWLNANANLFCGTLQGVAWLADLANYRALVKLAAIRIWMSSRPRT